MRIVPVPVQITEEEKIIGGHLTGRQLGYLIAGVALGGGAFALPFPIIVRFIFFCLFCILGAVVAFVRLHNMLFDVFLWRWFKWKRLSQDMVLRGDE